MPLPDLCLLVKLKHFLNLCELILLHHISLVLQSLLCELTHLKTAQNQPLDWSKVFVTKCCDPFKVGKHSGKLRNVSEKMCSYVSIKLRMKICDGCRIKLTKLLKNSASPEAG